MSGPLLVGMKTNVGIYSPRGMFTLLPRFFRFLEVRLSESVVAWAEYFDGGAQLNVTVSNKPGTDWTNPVTIFIGKYDGKEFDLSSGDLPEYEAYGLWQSFLDGVERDFPAADVMFS